MDCPFCNLELDKEQQVVFQSDHCLFLQKPQNVLIGSGVIVPKSHRETLFELDRCEWDDTYLLLQRVKNFLDDIYEPKGYNIGWNCGQIAGQEIFHAHLHVIPRFKTDHHAGKGIRYWLKQDTE